jgi:hypothetical protein
MALTAPVDVKGATGNTLSVALSALTQDHTVCIFAAHAASATPPSVPTTPAGKYIDMGSLSNPSGVSTRFYYCIATATTENGGTSTGCQVMEGIAYNGAGVPVLRATNTGTTANPGYPAATFSRIDGTSTCVRVGVNLSGTMAGSTLTNYAKRESIANGNTVLFDRATITTQPTADSSTIAASTWGTATIEVPALPGGRQINQAVNRAAIK